MPWWGILIMVVALQALSLVVTWLLFRRKGTDLSIVKELDESFTKRLKEEVTAEQRKREKVEAAYRVLAEETKAIMVWYSDNHAKIDREARESYDKLKADPAAIDRYLDDVLGNSSLPASDPEGTPSSG